MIKATKWTAFLAGVSQILVAFLVRGLALGDLLVMAYFLVSMVVLVVGVGYVAVVVKGVRARGAEPPQSPSDLASMWKQCVVRGGLWFAGVIVGGVVAVMVWRPGA